MERTVYKVESCYGKDRATIISDCESQGWSLYKIDDSYISFKKEIPSYFVCSYYIVENGSRKGPFKSEEEARNSLKINYSFSTVERVWQDPATLDFKNYSRFDKILSLVLDFISEEIVEKLPEKHFVDNASQLSSLLSNMNRDNFAPTNIRPLSGVVHLAPEMTRTIGYWEPSWVTAPAERLAQSISMASQTITSAPFSNNGRITLTPSNLSFENSTERENITDEERRAREREGHIRNIADYARHLARNENQ